MTFTYLFRILIKWHIIQMNKFSLHNFLFKLSIHITRCHFLYSHFFSVGISILLKIDESISVNIHLFHFQTITRGIFLLVLDKISAFEKVILKPILHRVKNKRNYHHYENQLNIWKAMKETESVYSHIYKNIRFAINNTEHYEFR